MKNSIPLDGQTEPRWGTRSDDPTRFRGVAPKPNRPKNCISALKVPSKSPPVVLGEFDEIRKKSPVRLLLRGDQSLNIIQKGGSVRGPDHRHAVHQELETCPAKLSVVE